MTVMPNAETIREFVIAGHGDLDKVKAMLSEQPDLRDAIHEWQLDDTETALQGASHVGNRAIAEYLLSQGAAMEVCTAAMLGRHADVERLLTGVENVNEVCGAHGIPLLAHTALSGDVDLVAMLVARGATDGISMALLNAVTTGHVELANWLLTHTQPDLSLKNFQGKTAFEVAEARSDQAMITLLRMHEAHT